MSRQIKVVDIDDAEKQINWLHAQLEATKRQQEAAKAQAHEAAKKLIEERMGKMSAKMADMRKNYEAAIENLGSEMAAIDRQQRAAMEAQAENFHAGLAGLEARTERTIQRVEQQFNQSIRGQQHQIDRLQGEIRHIHQKEADEGRRAQQMRKDLMLLLHAIEGRILPDKYGGYRWTQLHREIVSIMEGPHSPTAVIDSALRLTHALWNIEEVAFRERLEFEAMHDIVMNQATELLENMRIARIKTCFTDDKGHPIVDKTGKELAVDLNLWTDGEYPELEKDIAAFIAELGKGREAPTLSTERLKEIEESLNKMTGQQATLIQTAIERALASQARKDISEEIVNAMLEQGFELMTLADGSTPAWNYLGRGEKPDQREGVFAQLRNGNGMEVTIIIHPDETGTRNKILFQRNDNTLLTPAELKRSIEDVKRVIESKGDYKMGSIASPAGTGDVLQEEIVDANALQKVGLKRELRQRLGFHP